MRPPVNAEPDAFDSPIPPACVETRSWLQGKLDGNTGPESDAIREHCEQCGDCKSYVNASRVLLAGLPQLKMAEPTVGFAERVLAKAQVDAIRPWLARRWTLVGGFALAASVLIAVFVTINRDRNATDMRGLVAMSVPPPVEIPVTVNKPAPLRDSFQEATSAVSALTRRATEDGFGLKLPKWPIPKAPVDPKIEPALASLKEVGHNAEFSLAPITDSTRRAFSVFWRELGPDPKGPAAQN